MDGTKDTTIRKLTKDTTTSPHVSSAEQTQPNCPRLSRPFISRHAYLGIHVILHFLLLLFCQASDVEKEGHAQMKCQ